jgi:DNA-directed RNA polymerase specialized sigma24 family protein
MRKSYTPADIVHAIEASQKCLSLDTDHHVIDPQQDFDGVWSGIDAEKFIFSLSAREAAIILYQYMGFKTKDIRAIMNITSKGSYEQSVKIIKKKLKTWFLG